ncbi:MAG TPA: carboxypeptidase regulatory-like domain-containing protein [Thermogutta sp.]|nr:carboxypeptidase regulatory-like domain-containing protein [Thermogutta sp.]HQF14794.1 carboxypeptidase regulatory-like domain-containing protein [Thermogutta sp.]
MVWGRRYLVLGLIALSVILVLPGCTGRKTKPKGSVEGKVTFNGHPYTEASVVFFNQETGQGSSANIQPDGSFRLPERIEVGTYIVYLAPKMEEDPAAEPKPVSIDKTVPEKYWSESTSDIRVEVKTGSNQFNIDLKP